MAGSASDGIHIIGAGGVPADTGMDIDMGTGMGIVMDTDMGIVMAIMLEEERDTGQDIMQDPEILRKAMCIKIGQMEFGIPEPGLRRDRPIQVLCHQRDLQIHQQETDHRHSQQDQAPVKIMCIPIGVEMYIKGITAAVGSKEVMDSGTIHPEVVQARGVVQAI